MQQTETETGIFTETEPNRKRGFCQPNASSVSNGSVRRKRPLDRSIVIVSTMHKLYDFWDLLQ